MTEDIYKAIKNLEAQINAEEKQIQLMKNDLKILKEKLLQETNTTDYKSLPESLDKLFEQFYILDDTIGLKTRAYNVLCRNGKSIEDLYNISFTELSSFRNASGHVIAIIITVIEHYGIKIGVGVSKIAKQVEELLPVYREKIVFK